MTAEQLIEKLRTLPPSTRILIPGDEGVAESEAVELINNEDGTASLLE